MTANDLANEYALDRGYASLADAPEETQAELLEEAREDLGELDYRVSVPAPAKEIDFEYYRFVVDRLDVTRYAREKIKKSGVPAPESVHFRRLTPGERKAVNYYYNVYVKGLSGRIMYVTAEGEFPRMPVYTLVPLGARRYRLTNVYFVGDAQDRLFELGFN